MRVYKSRRQKKSLKSPLSVIVTDWFAEQKEEFEEDDFDIVGKYTQPEMSARDLGMDFDLSMIGHQDILKKVPYPKVLLGISEIAEPWMLSAFAKFGGWNDMSMSEFSWFIYEELAGKI